MLPLKDRVTISLVASESNSGRGDFPVFSPQDLQRSRIGVAEGVKLWPFEPTAWRVTQTPE
jgi:hypothetical protein